MLVVHRSPNGCGGLQGISGKLIVVGKVNGGEVTFPCAPNSGVATARARTQSWKTSRHEKNCVKIPIAPLDIFRTGINDVGGAVRRQRSILL